MFKKINLKNMSPFWKRAFFGFLILSLSGFSLYRVFNSNRSVLNSDSQKQVDELDSIEYIKSLHSTPKLISDPISDENTQKLIASNDLKYNENHNKNSRSEESEKKEEINYPTNQNNCDPYDSALKNCDMSEDYENKLNSVANNIKNSTKSSLSDDNINYTVKDSTSANYEVADLKKRSQEKSSSLNDFNTRESSSAEINSMNLLIASSGKIQTLNGRVIDIGSASGQIKAGTTVLAVLNESKTITSSGEQFASASVIGSPFDHIKFPEGITVLLKLKLNGTQDGIEGAVINCSSRKNSEKSIKCNGQLEDINGESSLRGEIYSSAGWTIISTAATTFLSGMSLAKLTTSTSQLGVTQDQTTTNAIYQALSSAIISMGKEISASFARSGTQISIPGRVVVRILFTEDSIW